MAEIAVLIPCYNEEKTVGKVVADYRAVLPEATIYIYNNNSTDGTLAIAQRLAAADGHVVVRNEYRQGKGNVIRSMFRDITADCYLMIDGDDTYPAEDAPQMVEEVLTGRADMVIGDRLSSTYFTENKRPFHNFGNMLVRGLINGLFGAQVKDIMTGYRAFS
ncbi:MAG: glycosyltransferase family 2 protein, partial [Ruthenibacterium sp.]